MRVGLKYVFVIVAVGAVAAVAVAAAAPVARAAAPLRSARLSSVVGASANISAHAGGSNRPCVTPLGIKTEVIMMEVNN